MKSSILLCLTAWLTVGCSDSSTSSSSSSGTASHCTDANDVCIENLTASADDAFEGQCTGEGGTHVSGRCTGTYEGTCSNATLHAQGTAYTGNIRYPTGFCGRFNNIDTMGSC